MKRSRRIVIAAAATVAGLAAAGVAAVSASTSDDADVPITGSDLQRASAAALLFTTEVDVQLDKDFQVVDSKADKDQTDSEETDSD